jgi:hypothetical protein
MICNHTTLELQSCDFTEDHSRTFVIISVNQETAPCFHKSFTTHEPGSTAPTLGLVAEQELCPSSEHGQGTMVGEFAMFGGVNR